MTFGKDGALKIIHYSDIYYIETIKQTHLCTIYHKNGTDIIRADISKLINELDERFAVTRSSTIANLSAAERVCNSMIYFSDEIFCSVTPKKLSKIKKIMRENFII